MGRVYDGIDDRLRAWIEQQPMFFVGSAPLAGDGHVNVSPKGLDGTFAVLDERRVAYLDLMGSGVETVAHVRENGRIVVMFCAFQGPPRIVRLHGRGTVHLDGTPEFAELCERFTTYRKTRSVIVVDVERVADSCGYGVPRMSFDEQRNTLLTWGANKTDEELAVYAETYNRVSVDGLPGVPA